MKFGAPRQQGVFWDVASKKRNRKSAALPCSLPIRTATRGVAVRQSAAPAVHRDRSAVRSKRLTETMMCTSDAFIAERDAKVIFDKLYKASKRKVA